MRFRGYYFALLALLLFGSGAPDPYPDEYFGSPLKIPLLLAGGFAEMRSNHFHAGLDIKTQGRAGYRVYAAADGWVSRIVVSEKGYGNALYISHPNGYMTVYAHLDHFSDRIREHIRGVQQEQESFAVQSFPFRDQFPVTKGEMIAVSGNSGGSAGPHLHFEIRDERTGWPVNPMLWGLGIKDTIPPRIYRFKVYPIGEGSQVRLRDTKTGGWRTVKSGESVFIELTRANGNVVMSRVDSIEASGKIGFGIQTHDHHNGSTSRLGAFRIQLMDGNSMLFRSVMEQFSFDQTRYINAHIDYKERLSSGRWVQLSHILPGNKLPLYESRQDGILELEPGSTHRLSYLVEDALGNSTSFQFSLHGIELATSPPADGGLPSLVVRHDAPFSFSPQWISLSISEGTLYQDEPFTYEKTATTRPELYSDIHRIHKEAVPVHKFMKIGIIPTFLPTELREKALVVRVDGRGKISSAGGAYSDGAVRSRIRSFGSYAVAADTNPPTVRGLNISEGKNMSASGEIRIRMRDDLSGIKSYRGLIDGKWVLFEYDAKYSLLRHRFENRMQGGAHKLDLFVEDNKENKTHLGLNFRR